MVQVEKRSDGEPCWFDLMAPDREKAKAFYSAVFGWDYADRDDAGMPYTLGLREGKPVAGIGTLDEGREAPSAWTVYFQTKNAAQLGASVKEKGGAVLVGPLDVGTEGKMALCTDPEGAVFGLWEPADHKGSAFLGDHGAMCWCELYVRNPDLARSFYDEIFSTRSEPMEAPGMTYFTFVGERGRPQAGLLLMTEEWGDMPAHWMAYFAVEDADAACATVKEAGGEVKHGPFDTPFGRMAVISDPGGAVLTIIVPVEGT